MTVDDIARVSVIGAGLMGHGIAQEFAQYGYRVALHDVDDDRLRRAVENIRTNVQMLVSVNLATPEQVNAVPEAVSTSTDLREVVHDADVVIEAISENLVQKQQIFEDLDRLCPAHTARTAAAGLAASLLAPLQHRDAAGLIRALEVLPTGGVEGAPQASLIGPGRAADMAINVIVPFALALATILGDNYLAAAAWQTAGELPPGEESEPTRHMKALLAASGHRLRTACALDTQGLIHLYRSFCSVQACWECPLALGSGTLLTESL